MTRRFSSPLEAFNHWVESIPNEVFLRQPVNRKFVEFTFAESNDQILRMVSALHNLGIQPGDHVALLSKKPFGRVILCFGRARNRCYQFYLQFVCADISKIVDYQNQLKG